MEPSDRDIDRLIGELTAEMLLIDELADKNLSAKQRIDAGAREEIDWVWLGYTIHNLYNAIENYCLRVAKFFENSLDQRTWHSDLINRMQIEIPNLRPALLDRETGRLLDELRAFRHVFRNVYRSSLDSERLALTQSRVGGAVSQFGTAHAAFLQFLEDLKRRIDG